MIELLQSAPSDAGRVDEFYGTLSMLSFTLLGLWWVVVQLRLKDGAATARERRHIYSVLLFFLLPGLMSLFSVVDDSSTWWRLVFGATAIIGMGEIALYYQATEGRIAGVDLALRAVGFVDYVLIALVAMRPQLASDLSLGITGLQLEAILVAALFVIGIHMVFLAIVERPAEPAQ